MKIKSIVLTAALATAFSAFSASVDVDWFTTNVTSVVKYFDRNINDPVVVTNTVPTNGWTVSSYAITAYVTNLVIFASQPSVGDLKTGAKGAICAAYDSSVPTNRWYGLYNNSGTLDWSELTTTAAPVEGGDYKLRMEFSASNSTVKYNVSTISGDTPVATSGALTRSGDANFVTNLCAFAGMGGCTNIVGEIVVTASGTAVEVSGGKILVVGDSVTSEDANSLDVNNLAKWVNYVLGIDGSVANNKPYAAPVQNSSSGTLTFKLGGVGVIDQNQTGAKVTYTVEELESPTDISGTPRAYVGPNDPVSVDLSSEAVKYYRIKIKIDPAHEGLCAAEERACGQRAACPFCFCRARREENLV